MSKRFWLIIVVIAIAFGVIFKLTSDKGSTNNSVSTQPTSHIEGEGKDGVTLIEYGDYECPYCGEYFSTVKQVQAEYNQQIFFQFRNLPLTQIHVNAFAGARAAEAAALQDKFWQMHDALYESQSSWVSLGDPSPFFVTLATQLGLNVTKFKTDYSGSQVNNSINADLAAFNKTGLQEATPTFILDGKQIQPQNSVAAFEQFINAEIAKKTGQSSSTPAPTNSTTGTNQSVQPSNTTK